MTSATGDFIMSARLGLTRPGNRDHRQGRVCWQTMEVEGEARFSGVKMFPLVFAGIALVCADLLLGQAEVGPLANVTVTITPAKATLFSGDTQTFVATVVGVDDKTVNWSVDEQDGGAITDLGRYTAPKIQGIYHITATSRARPESMAVATITVLVYCDPPPAAFRP